MKKVLILFAHPYLEKSKVNKPLIKAVSGLPGVTAHDLYELYPDFNIDIPHEQSLLEQHDVIVWHHPFYWYSCPPLLKQWIDMVLEYNWAYGRKGTALQGKMIFNAITVGGSKEVYCTGGKNRYAIGEFLHPFEQTARLCGMDYLPPFTVMGTHGLSTAALNMHVEQYTDLIKSFVSKPQMVERSSKCQFLNELVATNTTGTS